MKIRIQDYRLIRFLVFPLIFLTWVAFCLLPVSAGASEAVPLGADPAWQVEDSWFREGGDLARKAEKRFEEGNYADAAKLYGRMAKLATTRANAAWATMRKAEMHIADGRYNLAVEEYKKTIRKWSETINFKQAIGRLRELAEAYTKVPGSFLVIIPIDRKSRAIEVYEFILKHAPESSQAPNDQLRLAQLLLEEGRLAEARKAYRDVFEDYPRSSSAPKARLEYIRLVIEQARKQEDKTPLLEAAKQEASLFLRLYPDHELASKVKALQKEARELKAEHYLAISDFYLHESHYNASAARRYLSKIEKEYGDTEAAVKARKRISRLESSSRPDSGEKEDKEVEEEGGGRPETAEDPAEEITGHEPETEPEKITTYSPETLRRKEMMEKRLIPLEETGLPVFSSLAVKGLENTTREPELSTVLRHQLHEEIMREETVKLEGREEADVLIEIRIDDFLYQAVGTAGIRDKDAVPDSLDEYSTTLYTAKLELAYRVVSREKQEALTEWRLVTGEADFPAMPDMAMSRQSAIEQAAASAAGIVVRNIVESW